MLDFLRLDGERRRKLYNQVSLRMGIHNAEAIERDLWLTAVLQAVFTLPYGDRLVFHGGASLGKAWRLIGRLTGTVRLAVEGLPMGDSLPASDDAQAADALPMDVAAWCKDVLAADLRGAIYRAGLWPHCNIYTESGSEPMGDKECATGGEPIATLHVTYQSAFGEGLPDYLQPEVLIELSAGSMPAAATPIRSFVEDHTPVTSPLTATAIRAATPEWTFVEKLLLLHTLFSSPHGYMDYKARHLYDVERLLGQPCAGAAIADTALWEAVAHQWGMSPDVRQRIVLVPEAAVVDEWRDDYEALTQTMVFGEHSGWDNVLQRMAEVQAAIRAV